jgi:hypothetical protein
MIHYLPIFWIVFTSGLTFWQADRILIIIYPIMVSLVVYLISKSSGLKSKKGG